MEKLAFMFPGQGSQSVGMLGALAEAYPQVKELFGQASEVLGFDLWAVTSEGPEDKLNDTAVTQPAMLAAGCAVWHVWKDQGGSNPVAMAGHSLGEYSALVCAGAMRFDDAVSLVAERGRLMQEAVPAGQGAMAAILGLDDETVRSVCEQARERDVVNAVNYNAPGQVVIAGNSAAVERAVALAKDAGAKRAVPLPVSVPSHCSLMEPAAEKLGERLQRIHIQAPEVPVLHNYDVRAHSDVEAIRNALVRQLHNPVRWVEIVQALVQWPVELAVEAGPGKVLAGLNRRIHKGLTTKPVFDPETLRDALV